MPPLSGHLNFAVILRGCRHFPVERRGREVALLDAVDPAQLSYPALGIAITNTLFDERQPDLPQLQDIFARTEAALELALASRS